MDKKSLLKLQALLALTVTLKDMLDSSQIYDRKRFIDLTMWSPKAIECKDYIEEIFNTSLQPLLDNWSFQTKADLCYHLIDEEKYDKARVVIGELEGLLGLNHSTVLKLSTFLHFMEE